MPLVAALFLMGCSYGCDSNNKIKTDYDSEDSVEEVEAGEDEFAPLKEENLEDTIEEIREEDPVIEPDPEDAPSEDYVDQEEPYISEDDDGGHDESEPSAPNESYMQEGEVPEAPQQEEEFETQEEPYVDDGEVYEDDYPD